MASTKEMQARAKARKNLDKAIKDNTAKYVTVEAVQLYQTDDLLKQHGLFNTIMTPEGIQAYKNAIVNIGLIPKGKMTPTKVWMTGYGASYMSKVMGGTPRGNEQLMNAFLDGNENGDMLQISYTKVEDFDEQTILLTALKSLGEEFAKKWSGRYIKTECGKAPTTLGWVKATA
jgi:hypothetical protein